MQTLTSSWQGKVKNCYKAEKEKHRETKMAYADIAPKAPRSVQKAQVDMNLPESIWFCIGLKFQLFLFQVKNGTFVATGSSLESVRRYQSSTFSSMDMHRPQWTQKNLSLLRFRFTLQYILTFVRRLCPLGKWMKLVKFEARYECFCTYNLNNT